MEVTDGILWKFSTNRKTNTWLLAQNFEVKLCGTCFVSPMGDCKLGGHEFKSHVRNIPDVHINRFQNVVQHCWRAEF